ncbi:transposase [Granulicella arctica]|uniref:Transposase n=1 Tax=Granulicella arctica TaxID=940613 RepID=A0A7Y9PGF5_9BACT|nr:transposase [Granulicella arctica]
MWLISKVKAVVRAHYFLFCAERLSVALDVERSASVGLDLPADASLDRGHTGQNAAKAAQQQSIKLEVVKHPMAKRGFVLLSRRWVVEQSFAWAARFRRLAHDYERLETTLKGLHFIDFARLMCARLVTAYFHFITSAQ